MPQKALLLMNMGGATTKAELHDFLMNMFRDPNILTIQSDFFRSLLARFITQRRLDASWSHYEQIGGSPLPRITDELIKEIQIQLGDDWMVRPVMCYTKPGNREIIEELAELGIQEVILFPLYPHYSTTTVKSSIESFLRDSGNQFHTTIIEPFFRDWLYNETIVENIRKKLGEQTEEQILIFSAHGLPEKIVKRGDPYQKQIEEHVQILSQMLEKQGIYFKDIKLAYQSRVGPMKWLAPSLEQTLAELSGEQAIVFPISFTIDNSETMYELHEEYREVAKEIGVKSYIVCDCPNTHPKLVESIIKMIHAK